MRTTMRGARLALIISLCAIPPARAQTLPAPIIFPGAYVGLEGGYTDLLRATNRSFNITQGPDQGLNSTSLEQFRGGFNIGGRAGFQLGPLRLEGEVNYRDKNLGRGVQMISPVNRVGRGQNAERHSVSEMANLIYDFDLGLPVNPHIGGGIGAAEVTRNLSNIFGGTTTR